MKKFTILTAICCYAFNAFAFSFSAVNNGKYIYYNIISAVEPYIVEVTYATTKYSGNIVIPEYVTYGGNTYAVTSIGDNAFSACNALNSVTIPNSVTSIGNNAFSNDLSLTYFVMPNSVTTIGNQCFSACMSLISVNLSDSLTSIGTFAFAYCDALRSITIPSSVTSIGDWAFAGCTALTFITNNAIIPPAIGGTNVFNNLSSSLPVHIPCGTYLAYQNSAWSQYFVDFVVDGAKTEGITSYNEKICYGTTFTDENFTTPLNLTGIYYVDLFNIAGCDSIVALHLTVLPQIQPKVINTTICYGENYLFKGENRHETGTYKDTLQTINNCDSIIILNLIVDALVGQPNDFSVIHFNNGHKIFWTAATNNGSYEIYRNGELLANVTSTSYQDNNLVAGNTYCYKVKSKSANGCYGDFTQQECIEASNTGIDEISANTISIYPNPATDIITIDNIQPNETITITDLSGRIVGALRATPLQNGRQTINVSSLPQGVYLLRVGNEIAKLIKK
ncbi:hypothetical protein FACS189429_7930 [Bacteroidia bacterium]|nr:hypothetical protein FACS189429_7930 [Bacteroidia bacterium]